MKRGWAVVKAARHGGRGRISRALQRRYPSKTASGATSSLRRTTVAAVLRCLRYSTRHSSGCLLKCPCEPSRCASSSHPFDAFEMPSRIE